MNDKKIVRRTEDFCNAVNDMNSAMAKVPAHEQERQLKVSEFKKKFPDALYLEPKERRPTGAKSNPDYAQVLAKFEERYGKLDHLLEYVVGIFESQMIFGSLPFDLGVIPGEDFCRWEIPVNKAIGVPRFVAQHLANNLGWKEMKPLGKDNQPKDYYEENMLEPFAKFEFKKRGHFYPLNAY